MIWEDDDFAKRYAVMSASGSDQFDSKKNELSLLGLVPSSTKTVLDFGCSGGHFTNRLSERYDVTGYDIAQSAREVAKNSFPNLNIVDTVTGKFDCIVLKLVLHLLDNPCELLDKLVENLAVRGCFVVSLPHPIYCANKYDIDYDKTDETTYIAKGGLANTQHWRPLKYWVELFGSLGFVMVSVDELTKDNKSMPKRFNACFIKKQ
jgi:trans-aconitate methyltransferase